MRPLEKKNLKDVVTGEKKVSHKKFESIFEVYAGSVLTLVKISNERSSVTESFPSLAKSMYLFDWGYSLYLAAISGLSDEEYNDKFEDTKIVEDANYTLQKKRDAIRNYISR